MKNNELRMTPAALGAFLGGNNENYLAAATPGGIEAQEKRGQLEQAQKQTLPINIHGKEADFEALGFVFGDKIDDLFRNVTFPAGWSKKPTDHSMYTDVVDAKGRKRASIFYKAAFYDRSAHAYLERRFGVSQTWDDAPTTSVYIKDACGEVERRVDGLAKVDWSDREKALVADEAIKAAREQLSAWLDENYPGNDSPLNHWT